jgi:hypothetical protein
MRRLKEKRTAWAVKWRSGNRLRGEHAHLLGRYHARSPLPREFEGCPWVLFRTRREARDFIRERFAYIAERPDLQCEPHGWRMPIPVKVTVAVQEEAA